MKKTIRREKKKYTWLVRPSSDKYEIKNFKYKSSVLKYLMSMDVDALNSVVSRTVNTFDSSYTNSESLVWFNEHDFYHGSDFKLVFKKITYGGRKYIHKIETIEKTTVKFFAFSDKIISLMGNLSENLCDNDLIKLLLLFHKRGFRDFETTDEYYNSYLDKYNIETLDTFFYWSDRCNFMRCKIIHDLIKRDKYNIWLKFEKLIK